jgi:hypothetical protein
MADIDSIMRLLDWNNPQSEQEKGRDLAKDVECINVFLQPLSEHFNKNVWDNCARILEKRSDRELQPYLPFLLSWVEDMNWPGAEIILERLKEYRADSKLHLFLKEKIREANALDKINWLMTLCELRIFYDEQQMENLGQ